MITADDVTGTSGYACKVDWDALDSKSHSKANDNRSPSAAALAK